MMWVLNLIQFALPVALILVGVFAGKWTERRHFRRLAVRESALKDMLVTDTRSLPAGCTVRNKSMVVGEVVVASDYFKTFVSKLRRIVGGELRAFETLMERARREAAVRMLEQAKSLGANGVINVRFASSNIGSMRKKGRAAMVEMYAYGTAIQIVPSISS